MNNDGILKFPFENEFEIGTGENGGQIARATEACGLDGIVFLLQMAICKTPTFSIFNFQFSIQPTGTRILRVAQNDRRGNPSPTANSIMED